MKKISAFFKPLKNTSQAAVVGDALIEDLADALIPEQVHSPQNEDAFQPSTDPPTSGIIVDKSNVNADADITASSAGCYPSCWTAEYGVLYSQK